MAANTIEGPALPGGARALDLAECHELLRERGWGILSTVEVTTTRPYAVPVAYAFDGDAIYIATGRGRKLRALESNSGLCLTVTDVERFDRWRSVIVIGSARWVSGALGRAAAIRAFGRQQRPGQAPSAAAAALLLSARIFRIEVAELGGRSSGPAGRPADDASSLPGTSLGDQAEGVAVDRDRDGARKEARPAHERPAEASPTDATVA